MLSAYKKKHHSNNFQYILIDKLGNIIEADNQTILNTTTVRFIQEIHPFFESVETLFTIKNEEFIFNCVNMDFDNKDCIVDIKIDTNETHSIIAIENLTSHYNNYQLTAQTRNESIINSQVLELKNNYLIEKEQFKSEFLSNFSHQLRNPITATSIFSRLLSETNLNSEQKNYIDIILSANRDLKNRIEDILEISKIESGKLILQEEVFNLKKILTDITSGYVLLFKKKKLNFIIDIDDNVPEYVDADQFRLKQILGNLLNNALNYTSEGFIKLHISTNYVHAGKANLHIVVEDTGVGIDKNYHDVVFERFTKVDSNGNNNIGLGLSIVKHLVTKMNGNISLESDLGKGSKFICNLSLKVVRDRDKIIDNNSLKHRKSFETKKKLLLIEDSELIQLSILKILSSDGNFFLNIISNGEDVISTILNEEYDIILISNTIQRYTAEDITKSIKETSKYYKRIPVLALSSEVFKEDIKRYKASGIKDIIVKPFDKDSLLDKLYKYVKK